VLLLVAVGRRAHCAITVRSSTTSHGPVAGPNQWVALRNLARQLHQFGQHEVAGQLDAAPHGGPVVDRAKFGIAVTVAVNRFDRLVPPP
jgi:hypothetical protein